MHGEAEWHERQPLDAHLHDDFGDGFLVLNFELFDGLLFHAITNRISSS
jgi:hypothetical protein